MTLKTTIYTFKNKKPVFFDLKRFYKVKNQKEMDKVVNNLMNLNIDAVSSPCPEDIVFPAVLELQSGFSLSLKNVNKKRLRKEIKKLKKIVN